MAKKSAKRRRVTKASPGTSSTAAPTKRELAKLLTMCHARDEGELLRRMDPLGWRREPIAKVFASEKDVDAITQAAKLKRGELGELQDWLVRHKLRDVKGWGPEKEAKLADELYAWWRANPQWLAKGGPINSIDVVHEVTP